MDTEVRDGFGNWEIFRSFAYGSRMWQTVWCVPSWNHHLLSLGCNRVVSSLWCHIPLVLFYSVSFSSFVVFLYRSIPLWFVIWLFSSFLFPSSEYRVSSQVTLSTSGWFCILVCGQCESCWSSLRFHFSFTLVFFSFQSSQLAAIQQYWLEWQLGIHSILRKDDNVVNCMNIFNGFVKKIKA